MKKAHSSIMLLSISLLCSFLPCVGGKKGRKKQKLANSIAQTSKVKINNVSAIQIIAKNEEQQAEKNDTKTPHINWILEKLKNYSNEIPSEVEFQQRLQLAHFEVTFQNDEEQLNSFYQTITPLIVFNNIPVHDAIQRSFIINTAYEAMVIENSTSTTERALNWGIANNTKANEGNIVTLNNLLNKNNYDSCEQFNNKWLQAIKNYEQKVKNINAHTKSEEEKTTRNIEDFLAMMHKKMTDLKTKAQENIEKSKSDVQNNITKDLNGLLITLKVTKDLQAKNTQITSEEDENDFMNLIHHDIRAFVNPEKLVLNDEFDELTI